MSSPKESRWRRFSGTDPLPGVGATGPATGAHAAVGTSSLRLLLVLLWLTVAAGCGLVGDPDERVWWPRQPHDLEYQYINLARFIQSEKPCFLISHDSISLTWVSGPGRQAAYLRSICFHDMAVNLGRPELCDHVVSVSTPLQAGHARNQQACRESVAQSCCAPGTGRVERSLIFDKAGLSPTAVEEMMHRHELPDWATHCLLYSPAFFVALEQLPHFAGDTDLEQARAVEWRPHRDLSLRGSPCRGRFLESSE